MKKNFTSYCLYVAMFISMLTISAMRIQAQGLGTATNPYQIQNLDQLKAFRDAINCGHQFYCNPSTFAYDSVYHAGYDTIPALGRNTHFLLTDHIVMNTGDIAGCGGNPGAGVTQWTPIKKFSGHFDGGSHIISGMYINTTTNEQGFIGQLTDTASVVNLGLENLYVKGNRYVGGIASAMLAHSLIRNCYVFGSFESSNNYVGAIVGSTVEASRVANCYSTGHLSTKSFYVGGIVGFNGATCELDSCYTSVQIEHTSGGAGGVYGLNEGSVSKCVYDKQMCVHDNAMAMGMLTGAMVGTNLKALFGDDFFGYEEGYYPYLKSFGFTKPEVKISVIPVVLPAVSGTDYTTMDNVDQDFTLSNVSGATWSYLTYNNSGKIEGNEVKLIKQGWLQLSVEMDGVTRSFEMVSKYGVELGVEGNPWTTEGNAFTIDSLPDLIKFREGIATSEDFKYKHNIVKYTNRTNIHWIQTADIDLSSISNWTPITNFTGHYDGKDNGVAHKIVNLKYTLTRHYDMNNTYNLNTYGYRGFFTKVENATIRNLGFENAKVKSNNSFVGIIAGKISNTIIDSCYVLNSELNVSYNQEYIGAICGRMDTIPDVPNTYSVVSNCYVENTRIEGNNYIGGLVGHNRYGTIKNSHVKNCTFPAGSRNYVGGICGHITAFVNHGIIPKTKRTHFLNQIVQQFKHG